MKIRYIILKRLLEAETPLTWGDFNDPEHGALRRLMQRGLVYYSIQSAGAGRRQNNIHQPVTLTEKGRTEARPVEVRHDHRNPQAQHSVPDSVSREFVYPGHPITIAAYIVEKFPSLAAASELNQHNTPVAVASNDIPGAGGNVYHGLELLHNIRDNGLPAALTRAKEVWRIYTKDAYQNRRDEGEHLSHRHLEILRRKLAGGWPLSPTSTSPITANAGTCPICTGIWMLVKTGLNKGRLVNHGFMRPGEGWQTDGCFGEKALPYEKSTAALTRYLDHLEKLHASTNNWLDTLKTKPPAQTRDRCSYSRTPPLIAADHPNYQPSIERAIADVERQITTLNAEITRSRKKIDQWPGEQPLKHKEPVEKRSLTDRLVVGQQYQFGKRTVTLKQKGLAMSNFGRETRDGAAVEFSDGKTRTVRARQLKPVDPQPT